MIPAIDGIRRVAVVTGSNQGIGYFIALQLAMSGRFQDVVLACRNESRAMQAVASMQPKLTADTNGACCVSYETLELGNSTSHQQFVKRMEENFGKVDCLVNNAAMAFKTTDPTPHEEQCTPTLDINFRGTVDFTEKMLPLIRKGEDARIVNLSSSTARLDQVSPELQKRFSSDDLTMEDLRKMMDAYERDVKDGTYAEKGWSNTNYGMSKLAITAATRVLARAEAGNGITVNCCDPGYCKTSMTSQRGTFSPEQGARTAVMLALEQDLPDGEFFANEKVTKW